MLSQILGNLLAAFIIDLLDQVSYFYIMAGVCVASSFIFATLKTPKERSDLLNTEIAVSYIPLKD